MVINKSCSTCKFNFSGTCAAHESFYGYGERITDRTTHRDCWDVSLGYYDELVCMLPEDEKQKYNHSFSLSFEDLYYYIENGQWKPRTRKRKQQEG
jgi:hypothetical protein